MAVPYARFKCQLSEVRPSVVSRPVPGVIRIDPYGLPRNEYRPRESSAPPHTQRFGAPKLLYDSSIGWEARNGSGEKRQVIDGIPKNN